MNSKKGICPHCKGKGEMNLFTDTPYEGIELEMCLEHWREYIDAMDDAVADEEEDAREYD